MRNFGLLLCLLLIIASPPTTVNADGTSYPGASLFSFQCRANGIAFFLKGTSIFQASFTQISGPLAIALAAQQNQPVILSEPASLWALKSNEFQLHLNADPDGTKLVLSTDICGQISVAPVAFAGQAIAYVRVTGGGQAVAFARVTASGQVIAYVQVTGTGQAFAFAQTTGHYVPRPGEHVHIVQPGETLYSIARRYQTTVSVLVTLNNLGNPNRISIGQVIRLP